MSKHQKFKRSLAYAKQLKQSVEGLVTVLLRSPSYMREYERLKTLPHIDKDKLKEAFDKVKNAKKRLPEVTDSFQLINTFKLLDQRDNSSLAKLFIK